MKLFSERYGYLNPREVIVREQITGTILNAIINWLVLLYKNNTYKSYGFDYREIEQFVWVYFLNNRVDTFSNNEGIIKKHLLDENVTWFSKLDLIEVILECISSMSPDADLCINHLNSEFERHNFAYRIVDCRFVEITSDEEIKSVEDAIGSSIDGVRIHLQTALKHLSASQGVPDYRNSIKESISAVECLCRNITGENTLGKALQQLESKGVSINSTLKSAFEKLYGYTNNADTGVRHALMDDANAPTSAEALYMLVTCSAFINYLNIKNS